MAAPGIRQVNEGHLVIQRGTLDLKVFDDNLERKKSGDLDSERSRSSDRDRVTKEFGGSCICLECYFQNKFSGV